MGGRKGGKYFVCELGEAGEGDWLGEGGGVS